MNAEMRTTDDPICRCRNISLTLQVSDLEMIESKSVLWFKIKVWLWMTKLILLAKPGT
jgi:hypothetical protein